MVEQPAHYSGSFLLLPWSNALGLTVDKLNLLLCQLIALVLAVVFQVLLPPTVNLPKLKLHVELWIGVLMCIFCFGYHVIYIVILMIVTYIIVRLQPPHFHVIVLFFSVFYLSAFHLFRQITDYGNYVLDVTGPLMILIQKISGLAFSLHDGHLSSHKISAHKELALKRAPTLLEYSSYVFYFHGVMVGPSVFFKQYMAFIDPFNALGTLDKPDARATHKPPFPVLPVVERLVIVAVSGYVFFSIGSSWTSARMATAEFTEMSFIQKNGFLIMFFIGFISKYYVAWKLAEAINLCAGLAFSGFDANDGKATWGLTKLLDTKEVLVSLNLRDAINGWNMPTNRWLRHVVYERLRAPFNTPATYLLSAFWHGFYPGYYVCFLSAYLMLLATRKVHRNIRPLLLSPAVVKRLYDVVTLVTARITIGYCGMAFDTVDIWAVHSVYRQLYYYLHLLAVLAIFVLPAEHKHNREHSKAEKTTSSD